MYGRAVAPQQPPYHGHLRQQGKRAKHLPDGESIGEALCVKLLVSASLNARMLLSLISPYVFHPFLPLSACRLPAWASSRWAAAASRRASWTAPCPPTPTRPRTRPPRVSSPTGEGAGKLDQIVREGFYFALTFHAPPCFSSLFLFAASTLA